MRRIAVTALADGWKLTVDDVDNDMIFRSGRDAEHAARRLAERLARAGFWSEIRLHLKDGSLAARFLSPADPSSPAVGKRHPEARQFDRERRLPERRRQEFEVIS